MEYSIQLTFRESWVDGRLAYGLPGDTKPEFLILAVGQKIWMPDSFFQVCTTLHFFIFLLLLLQSVDNSIFFNLFFFFFFRESIYFCFYSSSSSSSLSPLAFSSRQNKKKKKNKWTISNFFISYSQNILTPILWLKFSSVLVHIYALFCAVKKKKKGGGEKRKEKPDESNEEKEIDFTKIKLQ